MGKSTTTLGSVTLQYTDLHKGQITSFTQLAKLQCSESLLRHTTHHWVTAALVGSLRGHATRQSMPPSVGLPTQSQRAEAKAPLRPLRVGQWVEEGDKVEVGPGSLLEMVAVHSSRIEVSEGAHFLYLKQVGVGGRAAGLGPCPGMHSRGRGPRSG